MPQHDAALEPRRSGRAGARRIRRSSAAPGRWPRALLAGLALGLIGIGPAGAGEAPAEPALLPVRNFQPIQLLFPGPPHASAGALAAGAWRVSVGLVESNTLNVSSDASTGTAIELDLETTRLSLGLRRGLGEGWEVGVELPYVARWGGVLDRPIELVERAVDQLNPTRERLRRGRTLIRYEHLGRVVLASEGPAAGLGDISVTLRKEIPAPATSSRWAMRGGVELASGDEMAILGSGGTDLWLGVMHTRDLMSGRLSANLNLIFPESPQLEEHLEASPYATAALAWSYPLRLRTSVSVQLGYYASALEGTGTEELELDLWDLSAALTFDVGGGWIWQLGGSQNLVYQSGADFSLLSQLVWTGG